MKFSKAWLQLYSTESLPSTAKLEEVVTFNAFEIEEVTKYEGDAVIDIKVLPNRAHDALGHRGMARDITALLDIPFVDPHEYYAGSPDTTIVSPVITTQDTKACTRFMSVRIDGVAVAESPEWLKKSLNAIGQKSINSIVDITNYVQFALNKPMHAYDATLIAGNTLSARFARAGEVLTTLDEKTLALDEQTLVIADAEKPLGLAGIKGGKFSGIRPETTSIILESANFNPALIRKTAQKYNIRTDASKRFENEISDELAEEGLRMTIALVQKLNTGAKVGEVVDVWNRKPWQYTVSVSLAEINGRLGTSYASSDVERIFSSLGFTYTVDTTRNVIAKHLQTVSSATYKNPSSMREDAPQVFSCSSLVSYLFAGIWQPSISIDKYVYGEKVSQADARWGDLVFSNTGDGSIRYESVSFLPGTKVPEGVDHVGVYVGNGNVVHISKATNKVVTEAVATSKQFGEKVLYGRIVDVDEMRFFVASPHERLDIRIKEDLIEEVGRVMGLSAIKAVLPSLNRKGVPHKRLYYENKIKNILHAHDFSEIMTYSFGDVGEVSIVKGLASDKEKLRSTLSGGVLQAFQMNMLNSPLLAIDVVKMYEFGNVFTSGDERRQFAVVIDDGKKKSSFTDQVDMLLSEIKRTLGVSEITYETVSAKPYCVVIDFDTLIASLPEPAAYEPLLQNEGIVTYQAVSPYPFISRDIAMWTPNTTTWDDIKALVAQIASPLVTRVYLFDTFTKSFEQESGEKIDKTSYAFRLIFQSFERTLTDDEVNQMMEPYYELMKEKGFEVR